MIIWYFDLQLPVQLVPITTKVVSLNPIHGEVYLIHYVIKFVSDLRQVGGFLRVNFGFLHQYNWNIVESSVKHHKPKTLKLFSTLQKKQYTSLFTDVVQHREYLILAC
jgi:hypothetical protein